MFWAALGFALDGVLALEGALTGLLASRLEGSGRFDGSVGFGAGAFGLSASVAASAAARSAARAASLGVEGVLGGVLVAVAGFLREDAGLGVVAEGSG